MDKDNNITQKNVYYSPKTLNPKEKIASFKTVESPDYKSWFFFVDEHPYQNWEHACYYAFVNCETGELEIIRAKFPPKLSNMKVKVLQQMPPKGKLFDFKKKGTNLKSVTTYDASNDYAVIISGGYDDENNWFRYWNDCSAMYSALVDIYNYSPSHIYVIMSDGTSSGNDRVLEAYQDVYGNWHYTRDSSPLDLDGDGTNDIQYSATKSNISSVFNTLSNILDENDNLFVFTTDHGGHTTGSDVHLYLWGEQMTDDEFAIELDKVDAGKITVTMEQCHSGGFIDDLSADGRIISTACLATEESSALANFTYDEYVYHWISAIAGETPDGATVDADDNNDGWVSMREAFEYAENADNQTDETPQYNSTPNNLGCFVRLSDNWNWNISGPSLVCTNDSFAVNDVPTGATITWEDCSSTLTAPSNSSSNPGVFTKSTNGAGWVEASINNTCGSLTLPRKTAWVGPPSTSQFDIRNVDIFDNILVRGMYNQLVANDFAYQSGTTVWEWDYGGWDHIDVTTTKMISYVDVPYSFSYVDVKVRLGNICDNSQWYSERFYPDGDYFFSIYPNPASGEATISIESDSPEATILKSSPAGTTFDENAEWELEVYSPTQNLKEKKIKLKGKSTTIQTQSWKEGVYVVRVKYKDEILTGKLIVKK